MNQLISVIVPMFNAERWIAETLASVEAQTYPRNLLEIIVVDDGSTDASADIVARQFPATRLIRTRNGGPSRARNAGTKIARGTFLQYLDADDLLVRDKLMRQVQALENTGADVAYGDWQGLVLQSDDTFKPGDVMQRKSPPAAYLFHREIAERVGGWNERLPVIQDARFVLDCALHGATFTYCCGTMAYYRIHSQHSVSRRDPAAFIDDCLRSAREVEKWFLEHGGITAKRRAALIKVFEQVARATYENTPDTFETAYQALERLSPGGYMPSHPRHLALASKIVGYRRAEALAVSYRKGKSFWNVVSGTGIRK
ncbi:MAG: glycosyltransferase family A protein [Verrucomicrobiia bacterium]